MDIRRRPDQSPPSTLSLQSLPSTGILVTDHWIRGVCEGDLHTTGTVIVDTEGLLSARVTAEQVIVRGAVIGSICARTVQVENTGKIWGCVRTLSLHVERGGFVRGQIITNFATRQDLETSPLVLVSEHPDDDELSQLLTTLGMTLQEAGGSATLLPQALLVQRTLTRIVETENRAIWQAQAVGTQAQAVAERLAAELDAARDQIEQLNNALRAAGRQAEITTAHETEDKAAMQRLMAERDYLQLTLMQLRDEQASAQAARAEAEAAFDQLKAQLHTAWGEIEVLSDEILAARERADQLAAQGAEAQAALQQLTAERDQLQAEVEQLRQEQAGAQQLTAERDRLQAEIDLLRQGQGGTPAGA